jgi:N-acyl-D-amino-acid deacylase
MTWSLLVRHGLVIDGSGSPGVPADVAVEGERITVVGRELAGEAERVIEAAGLVVAPGFIDIHAHSDFFYLDCPSAESKVRQGVTTEVVGMCGFSPAPVGDGVRRTALEASAAGLGAQIVLRWTGFPEYLEHLEACGLSVNVVPFVGHGALRLAAVGPDARPAAPAEQARMQRLLAEALEAGAFGFSTGLVYPPGAYADTAELVELARSGAPRGALYFSHIRDEAARLLESVDEAIRIGQEAGVAVEVAHLKAASRENWPKLERALARIEEARDRGIDVTADAYPYTAGSTMLMNVLPAWFHDGGPEAFRARLGDPQARRRVVEECLRPDERWQTPSGSIDWDEVMVATSRSGRFDGQRLHELAASRDRAPAEAMLDLLREEAGAVSMIRFNQSEENVALALAHRQVMVGSDSIALRAGPGPHPGRPHPRTYGTFPRVLGEYVRARKLLSWEAAVHKMTGMPAARLGLRERGLLRSGYFADLTLFDPSTVRDEATYRDPHRYPSGIPFVVVNGEVVVDGGAMRPRPAGRVLRPG